MKKLVLGGLLLSGCLVKASDVESEKMIDRLYDMQEQIRRTQEEIDMGGCYVTEESSALNPLSYDYKRVTTRFVPLESTLDKRFRLYYLKKDYEEIATSAKTIGLLKEVQELEGAMLLEREENLMQYLSVGGYYVMMSTQGKDIFGSVSSTQESRLMSLRDPEIIEQRLDELYRISDEIRARKYRV